MTNELLSEEKIVLQIEKLHGWERDGRSIGKTVTLKDFIHAMGFVNSVALLAERMNHHPDIDIRWNEVTLRLSTHSANGLTEKDFALARWIDAI